MLKKYTSAFLIILFLSNFIFIANAKAAVTIVSPTAGICFQHTGTTLSGALVTVYNIGTIQVSLTAAEITPANDVADDDNGTVVLKATTGGSISNPGDVIGNVFSIIPPTGTNFVIVPGFQDLTLNSSNHLSAINATIANANAAADTGSADISLGISAGVVTTGTAGIGRAIVAIAKDVGDTYPKTGTSTNTVTISLNGLGIAIPPSGDGALSGTLQGTLDSTPPSGIGVSGGSGTSAVASAIPSLSATINLCTLTNVAGQLEAVSDSDDDFNDLYDKTTPQANLIALSQIGSNTSIMVLDGATSASTGTLDIEPILIRGISGTGSNERDQVFATGELLSTIDTASEASSVDVITNFGNSTTAPITIVFSDNNTTANTTLTAVDIIISSSTPGTPPTQSGFSNTQTSRHGFLGALRAATLEAGNTATNTAFGVGNTWGIASIQNTGTNVTVQESRLAAAGVTDTNALGALMTSGGSLAGSQANNVEPFNNNFVDLRINCNGTTPVSGWFAVLNSSTTAIDIANSNQNIVQSQAGTKFSVSNLSNFYTQALTNITGTTPNLFSTNPIFNGGRASSAADSTVSGNALLYASCANNTLTLFPIQNGFDAKRDIISVSPALTVSNLSNTFTSDVNIIAQVSGNNLPGTTTINLTKALGIIGTSGGECPAGASCVLASATGTGISEGGQLSISCTSSGSASVTLSDIVGGTSLSLNSAISTACSSGSIASPPALFKGGKGNLTSGSTIIDGSPVVQAEGRGVLIKELTTTGFSELVNKVGGGISNTVFEVQLPSGCDVIDDRDDNNTAVSATAGSGGNDISRVSLLTTGGITAAFVGGTSPADVTNSTAIIPATSSNPALVHFVLTSAPGVGTDANVTDAILVKFDAQDIFCPGTVADGALTGLIRAQNKTVNPTITEALGTVGFGTATKAIDFSIATDTATSAKGEISTNNNLGSTPRLLNASISTSHPFQITELNEKSFAIGENVSARNIDPNNTSNNSIINRGQIWITPSIGLTFSTAPSSSDISFSDGTIQLDGSPYLATTSTIDANAPLGTLVIGIKKGDSGNPSTVKTTITVKNLIIASAFPGTSDLIASAQFFSQDAGAIVNTPGAATGNSSSTPTVFTPYVKGETKANTQLNTPGLQIGTSSLANQFLTSRLTELGTPQISPFASLITLAKNADASKITSSFIGKNGTDGIISVSGLAGSVDGGSQVEIKSGLSPTYDSVTIFASSDGSFNAMVRGDCTNPNTTVNVSITEKISTISTTSVQKTIQCNSNSSGQTTDDVFNEIAGTDGVVTITEILTFITSKGGLASIISIGESTLSGVIKAAKAVLGLN